MTSVFRSIRLLIVRLCRRHFERCHAADGALEQEPALFFPRERKCCAAISAPAAKAGFLLCAAHWLLLSQSGGRAHFWYYDCINHRKVYV